MVREAEASKPQPSAVGTLAQRPTQHLLAYARDRALNGTLELDDGQGELGILVLARGRAVKARVDRASVYLGPLAYELGFVDRAALDATLAELARGEHRHGQLLLARGTITQAQLSITLMEQILRKLTHLHRMRPETTYTFYENHDGLETWPGDGPQVDPLPAIWRGVRDHVARAHLDPVLLRLGGTWRISSTAFIVNFRFDADTLELVDRLRAGMRIGEFVQKAGGSRQIAERLVFLLAITKQIEPVGEPPKMTTPPPSRPAPSASPSGTYARRISFELRTPSARNMVSSAPPMARPNPSPPPPPLTIPTRAEIAIRASTIASASLYDVLGVDRTANVEEIRAAYARLSRVWRSDRLPANLADVKEMCETVRARIDEAYRTLSNPEERTRYDLLGGSMRPMSRVDSETVYREAKVALTRSDIPSAIELCKRAHELAPEEGRYEALLAWLESQAPDQRGSSRLPEFVTRLDCIVRDDPECEEALWYRALLHRRAGDEEAAARDFTRVAVLNPKNIDAVREVRLHQMRATKK